MSGNAEAVYGRQRRTILALLLTLAAASWAALAWQAENADMTMMMRATMGLGAPLFLAVWVVMMAAMMFPAAAPMILTFASIQASRQRRGQTFTPTVVFVAGYMAVWSAAGLVAYAAAIAGEDFVALAQWPARAVARAGGAMLIAAGLYQLSPLKRLCLAKCQSPVGFILTSWREGALGALRMGLEHGFYCLGCCWPLFVILFPLGMMNIAAMAILTLVIFGEKSAAWGRGVARATAVALLIYGAAVLVDPTLLPTFMDM